jgi:hypothetical protein
VGREQLDAEAGAGGLRNAYAGRREQATCRTRASAAGARPGRRRAARSEQWREKWPGARVRQQACAAAAQERLAGGAGAKRPRRTGGVTAARTGTRERASAGLEWFVSDAEQVARACARWRVKAGGVYKCWAVGAERAHGREQAMLECNVPSNGTHRRSSGGKLLREMQERGSRIEDAAKVFNEMLTAGEVKLSLRSGSGSRIRAARSCADAARQGRGNAGPADEEEEEQRHEVVEADTAARIG